jgi:beta-glucosidase
MSLLVRYRLDEPATGPVRLAFGGAGLDVTPALAGASTGEWRELKVRLACFRDAGASIGAVAEPFRLSTTGRLAISLESVKLTTDPAGATCPSYP